MPAAKRGKPFGFRQASLPRGAHTVRDGKVRIGPCWASGERRRKRLRSGIVNILKRGF